MSYCEMKMINQNNEISTVEEFRNAHGFGAFIWNAVAEKYLGDTTAWLLDDKRFWPLAEDARLPEAWRATLLMSYDWAIVERPFFHEMAKHLRDFVMDVGIRDRVCHLIRMAELFEGDWPEDCVGVCFYGMSVGDDPWFDWDEEKEKYVPYSFETGENHWGVSAALTRWEKEHSKC